MLDLIRPKVQNAPAIKLLLNIGCTYDVPTGAYMKSPNGRWVLNGGLANTTGMAGKGNMFKSTILNYMIITAMGRMLQATQTSALTYDTEITISNAQLQKFVDNNEDVINKDVLLDGTWQITDKTIMWGNEFYKKLKDFIGIKVKNAEKLKVNTSLSVPGTKVAFKTMLPTFTIFDSLTEFETQVTADVQDKVELGDSAALTMHMQAGLLKSRMLQALPTLLANGQNFTVFSAHVGKEIAMSKGPIKLPPEKKLTTMRSGDKIMGVTDKFFFLLGNAWQTDAVKLLNNSSSDRSPMYPSDPGEKNIINVDLNIVTLKLLRSKTGPSGVTLNIIISQRDGVRRDLTEFHNCKVNGYYGLVGGNVNYHSCFLPTVKLSRTTISTKMKNNKQLRRAINITSELQQIMTYRKYPSSEYVISPEGLYDSLNEKGYDWDKILDSRGWHTVSEENMPDVALTTMDLLEIHVGGLDLPEYKKDTKK